ncbi:MAG: asparagine synthase (glutamine-hydrolyzing) [Alicyclobacillaceae bacterium]|nr:asparagine synthase (glutamine-hydrolyzing) [Alicyclobacillaceae bacterium]
MCGIAGWVNWSRDLSHEETTVRPMGESLAARGPDAAGVWLSEHCAFAHRRLIVVDPVGGAQPMTRRFGDRTFCLVYNGELYNTDSLRRDLIERGYAFHSYSDTEVVLVAYAAYGPAAVERFNGIFAFAIWDQQEQTLFLARDRLGVKPLFYSPVDGGWLFGSEIKAILAHPQASHQVDAEGLAEILAVGPARTPGHGIFRHIHELRAGHTAILSKSGCALHPYWKLTSYEHTEDEETTARTVHDLMVDTVERQLVSDVPVATFLSGGLDSSVVSAIAARYFQREGKSPLHTFSIEFANMDQFFKANEFQKSLDGPWARKVADFLSTVHHSEIFDTPDLAKYLLLTLPARDLPGMADIDTSLFLFCERIKQKFTVALSGESADEVFGGYPWFHRPESLQAKTFPWALRTADRISILHPDTIAKTRPYEYVQSRYADALAEVPRLPGESAEEARIREISYLSITRFLPTLLDRKDRMSMGTGLEVRVPFCDHRLVEYVFNIPWHQKTAGNQVKGILRKAMKGYLPDDALERKKSPYPSTPHPDYVDLVRTSFQDRMSQPDSPLRPLLNMEAISDWVQASYQKSEHRPWFGQIMAIPQMFHYLMEVDDWLRTYRVELV